VRTNQWTQHLDPPCVDFSQANETRKTQLLAPLPDHLMLDSLLKPYRRNAISCMEAQAIILKLKKFTSLLANSNLLQTS